MSPQMSESPDEQREELVEFVAREIQLRGLTAPAVHFHHCDQSRRSTGPFVGVKTSEPGTSFSFGGGGVPGGD